MSELFYTSVNRYGNNILVRGYKDGHRFKTKVEYKPTLYVPTRNESKFRTIDGRTVDEINPGTMRDCKEFFDKYKGVDNFTVYGNTNYIHQFINEKFNGEISFNRDLVNVTTIDIEVQSDEGFPQPKDALHPITAITIKNNVDDIFYVFGCGEYSLKDTVVENAHIKYVQCRDERQLLAKFLEQWMSNYPDVVTGWNSRMFDITYIVNRMYRVLGDKYVKALSPWKLVSASEIVISGNSNQAILICLRSLPTHTEHKRAID